MGIEEGFLIILVGVASVIATAVFIILGFVSIFVAMPVWLAALISVAVGVFGGVMSVMRS